MFLPRAVVTSPGRRCRPAAQALHRIETAHQVQSRYGRARSNVVPTWAGPHAGQGQGQWLSPQQSSSICTFHSRKGLAGARQVPWYDGTLLELGRDSRAPGLVSTQSWHSWSCRHCRYRAIARGSFAPVRPAPVGTGLGNPSHCPGGPFVHPHQTRCATCPLRPFQALRIPYSAFRITHHASRITRHTRIAHRGSRAVPISGSWPIPSLRGLRSGRRGFPG